MASFILERLHATRRHAGARRSIIVALMMLALATPRPADAQGASGLDTPTPPGGAAPAPRAAPRLADPFAPVDAEPGTDAPPVGGGDTIPPPPAAVGEGTEPVGAATGPTALPPGVLDAAGCVPSATARVAEGHWFVGCGDRLIELFIQPDGQVVRASERRLPDPIVGLTPDRDGVSVTMAQHPELVPIPATHGRRVIAPTTSRRGRPPPPRAPPPNPRWRAPARGLGASGDVLLMGFGSTGDVEGNGFGMLVEPTFRLRGDTRPWLLRVRPGPVGFGREAARDATIGIFSGNVLFGYEHRLFTIAGGLGAGYARLEDTRVRGQGWLASQHVLGRFGAAAGIHAELEVGFASVDGDYNARMGSLQISVPRRRGNAFIVRLSAAPIYSWAYGSLAYELRRRLRATHPYLFQLMFGFGEVIDQRRRAGSVGGMLGIRVRREVERREGEAPAAETEGDPNGTPDADEVGGAPRADSGALPEASPR